MNYLSRIKNVHFNRSVIAIFTAISLSIVAITILQDLVRAHINHSSFYFSEALIFSSFWWIFIPSYYIQYKVAGHGKTLSITKKLLLIVIPAAIHLFAFPVLVWIISGLFYYHTYAINQTFQYTLSEYLYLLAVAYTIPMLWYHQLYKRSAKKENKDSGFIESRQLIHSFLVTEGNKHLQVPLTDILYFMSSSPYIQIHLAQKKYLLNQTLKSISEKIDNNKFIRIHKSTIVNIHEVKFYTSRLNGDYDLTMSDRTILRVSRNFASGFKTAYKNAHQDTTV